MLTCRAVRSLAVLSAIVKELCAVAVGGMARYYERSSYEQDYCT